MLRYFGSSETRRAHEDEAAPPANVERSATWAPPGHFYSPLPSAAAVAADAQRLFSFDPVNIPGVALRFDEQLRLLDTLSAIDRRLPWAERQDGRETRYWSDNPFFAYGDGLFLYLLLRHLRPRRLIEVGSGFSSALALDVNDRFLDGEMSCTFIEPYPERLHELLRPGDETRATIIERRVQDVSLDRFRALGDGDVLFIDSSHVSKIGSDVNFLIFEVLPTLAPGVLVHIHDVFPGFEYPRDWIDEGRAWNENYMLRAFLQFNNAFEILLHPCLISATRAEELFRRFDLEGRNIGGSMWLRRSSGQASTSILTAPPVERARSAASERSADADYEARLSSERAFYEDRELVHDLPAIYHYWSNRYLLPKCVALGFSSIEEFFLRYLRASLRDEQRQATGVRFVSIGAGNCDFELSLVKRLVADGDTGFVLECLDINEAMLERGRQAAANAELSAYLRFTVTDINAWQVVPNEYAVVMANHSLHHVLDLEALFDRVETGIGASGLFVVNDMIGRNGHMRWPEALGPLQNIWAEMPDRYKFNRLLNRFEAVYDNWDCSKDGFEGIRAQDILPLLVRRFSFETFLGFANLVDVFIDRAFGPNFDPASEIDRAFLDRVAEQDEALLDAGVLKPTHMIAAMTTSPSAGGTRQWKHLSAASCVRPL